MHLTSTAFHDGEAIPRQYTSDGANVSPPLAWDDVPPGAKSLALIVDDPDAPDGVWTHWILADVPPDQRGVAEGATRPPGHVGKNDWNRSEWSGPAPPSGTHHYRFRLFALDRELGLDQPTKPELDRAIQGALVLAEAKLVGTYRKARAA